MIPKLIGISGKKGSGKNTVANMIDTLRSFDFDGHLIEYKSFADPLKRMICELTGCKMTQFLTQKGKDTLSPIRKPTGGFYTYRELLQLQGTEFGRNIIGPDIWVDALFAGWNQNEDWVITDVRFPNEVEAIEDRGGIAIRVVRPGIDSTDTHESETALDNYQFDYTIINECIDCSIKSSTI